MNVFNNYVISVCSAMIIASIVNILRPSGNMQNTIKVLTVVFFLAVCITPIIGFDNLSNLEDFNISKDYDIKTDLQDYINNEVYTESQKQLATKLGEILSVRGITEYSIKFECNNDYEVSCVSIYTQQKTKGLEEYLESQFDVDIKVVEE